MVFFPSPADFLTLHLSCDCLFSSDNKEKVPNNCWSTVLCLSLFLQEEGQYISHHSEIESSFPLFCAFSSHHLLTAVIFNFLFFFWKVKEERFMKEEKDGD